MVVQDHWQPVPAAVAGAITTTTTTTTIANAIAKEFNGVLPSISVASSSLIKD